MERESLEEELIEFISDRLIAKHSLEGERLTGEDDLLGSGLVDSLGVMQLIRFIEEKYGVTVPPADVTIEHFMTVDTLVVYLESLADAG